MIAKLNVAFPVVETAGTQRKSTTTVQAVKCSTILSLWLKPQAILIKHAQRKRHSLWFQPQEHKENRQREYKI
jgi:hypothetical protein